MKELLQCLAGVISASVFQIIFIALNKSSIGLFKRSRKYMSKYKDKKYIKIAQCLVVSLISVVLMASLNLSYFLFGIIIGFLQVLTDNMFYGASEK